jgi:hypothetical protein
MANYEYMSQLCEHERSQCQVVQNALVREVCEQFEAEANNFKKKIADLETTILDKKTIIVHLEKKILDQEKMIAHQEKIGKAIADHAANHALIGKSIAKEASKLEGASSLTLQLESCAQKSGVASNENTESSCDIQEGKALLLSVVRT